MYAAVKAHATSHALMESIIAMLPYDESYAMRVTDIVVPFHSRMQLAHEFGPDFPVEEQEFVDVFVALSDAVPQTPDTEAFHGFIALAGLFARMDQANNAETPWTPEALAAEADEWLRENGELDD